MPTTSSKKSISNNGDAEKITEKVNNITNNTKEEMDANSLYQGNSESESDHQQEKIDVYDINQPQTSKEINIFNKYDPDKYRVKVIFTDVEKLGIDIRFRLMALQIDFSDACMKYLFN